ncbi:MAG TPA: UbiD family decarboxylase [Thermodesulfobacteriaceae bacterium]|nr:UbiD family decarboxylase [Thermodesulfobacteriaceae bacterium]
MIYRDLQYFIDRLGEMSDLVRITESVSPSLEIAEFTSRLTGQRGPAAIFENVEGSPIPVLTNLFGSIERTAMVLGMHDINSFTVDAVRLFEGDHKGAHQLLSGQSQVHVPDPDNVPCQETVLLGSEADLSILPVTKSWPGDAGPALTLPVVFTRDIETGSRNAGLYRMQVLDSKTTCMHWYPGSGGDRHFQKSREAGSSLECAVALGPEPVMTWAAAVPLPVDVDEVLFASCLQKKNICMAKCITVDIEVPAASQIVIEGYVDPEEKRLEGPFGTHAGYYSPAADFPVFHVSCITMRKDAVYPATVVGPPPQEDCYMAKAMERLVLQSLKRAIPSVVDINRPLEAIFQGVLFVSIDKSYAGQGRDVVEQIWGFPPLNRCMLIYVFDRQVDIQDMSQVMWRIGTHLEPVRDTVFGEIASPGGLAASCTRMGIDCTRKLPGEVSCPAFSDVMKRDPAVTKRMDRLWEKVGPGQKPETFRET